MCLMFDELSYFQEASCWPGTGARAAVVQVRTPPSAVTALASMEGGLCPSPYAPLMPALGEALKTQILVPALLLIQVAPQTS